MVVERRSARLSAARIASRRAAGDGRVPSFTGASRLRQGSWRWRRRELPLWQRGWRRWGWCKLGLGRHGAGCRGGAGRTRWCGNGGWQWRRIPGLGWHGGRARRCSRSRRGSRGFSLRGRMVVVIDGNSRRGHGQCRTEKKCVFCRHFLANPSRPKSGRRRTPATEPANAAANQSHPCRLPVAIPLKSAPMLQPKESRAP